MLSRVIGKLGTRVKPCKRKHESAVLYRTGNSFRTTSPAFSLRAWLIISFARSSMRPLCAGPSPSSRCPSPGGRACHRCHRGRLFRSEPFLPPFPCCLRHHAGTVSRQPRHSQSRIMNTAPSRLISFEVIGSDVVSSGMRAYVCESVAAAINVGDGNLALAGNRSVTASRNMSR
jgi:hypothetical protein